MFDLFAKFFSDNDVSLVEFVGGGGHLCSTFSFVRLNVVDYGLNRDRRLLTFTMIYYYIISPKLKQCPQTFLNFVA